MKNNVLRGIELLDRQVPGWRDRIDWDKLDMTNCYKCILGQLFGEYSEGVEELGALPGSHYGFDAPPYLGSGITSKYFTELAELWRQAAKAEDEAMRLAAAPRLPPKGV